MDAEIRQEFERVDERLSALEQRMEAGFAGLVKLIEDLSASLQREIKEAAAKHQSLEARVALHAGLLQGGSRVLNRFVRFAEDSETRWVDLTKQMNTFDERLERIEKNGRSAPPRP